MPDYKGIPFDGGLDSPSGTGAQSIVATLKAIIDFLLDCSTPGVLADSIAQPSINFDARTLINTAGDTSVQYQACELLSVSDGSLCIGWNSRQLTDNGNTAAVDWGARRLVDTGGATEQLAWSGGIFMRNLPTTDPGVSGQIWNNLGVLAISP